MDGKSSRGAKQGRRNSSQGSKSKDGKDVKTKTNDEIDNFYFFSGKAFTLGAPKSLAKASKFDPESVEKFAENDPTLSKFFPIIRRKKNSMRDSYANFPLDRVHCDLANMQNEHGGVKYALICRDIYSHKIFSIPTPSKNATDMTNSFRKLLEQMMPLRKRFPTVMKSTLFMSDRGLDFNSRPLTNLLTSQGHRLVYLNAPFKAFGAELSIKHYRQKLALVRARLGEDVYKKQKGWIRYNNLILKSLNNTPSRSLANFSPEQVFNMNKRAIQAIQEKQPKFTLESWLTFKRKQVQESKLYLNKFCRLVIRYKNYFTKISMKPRLSDMIFKIIRFRPATMSNPQKHILLKVKDMANNELRQWYRIDDISLIPEDSLLNPGRSGWKPTIKEVVSKSKVGRAVKYKVKFLGKFQCLLKR